MKQKIADCFVAEATKRAKLKMKFPTPNYRGLATAPGFVVVVADFRYVRAFAVLLDGSGLDRQYQANAERILLQSVAASAMSAHLAAAALRYQVWWLTAIGQENARICCARSWARRTTSPSSTSCCSACRPPPYKRWKKTLPQIMNWDKFDMKNYQTLDQIDDWVRETRHKVMFRDQSKVD